MRFLCLFIFTAFSLSAQTWVRLKDFPGSKRDDGAAVVVSNTAFFGTGLQEGWNATRDWYALNLTTYTWTNLPHMPEGTDRQYACAFAGNDCFYVFGGSGAGGALNDLLKFDVAANSWTVMTPLPGPGLVAASCMAFGNRVVIAGGRLLSGAMNRDVWEYNLLNNSWQKKNPLPFSGRWRASATELHGFGYLLFGIDSSGSFRKELYRYDPNVDAWTKTSDFPLPAGRAYSAVAGISNKLFVFGGYDSLNNYFNDSWYYSDVLKSWSQATPLPAVGRRGGMYCHANNQFYYACGLDKPNNRLAETWSVEVPLSAEAESPKVGVFEVYPNPCSGPLTVRLAEAATLSVLNSMGQELLRQQLVGGNNEINLQPCAEGLLVLVFDFGNGVRITKKVIRRGSN